MRLSKILVLSLLVFGTVSNLSGKRIPSYAGPYVITCRTLNNVSDQYNSTGKMWGHLYFSHPRPKQLQYLWGPYYVGAPLSDELKAEVRVSVRSNNQWKHNAFVFKFSDACSSAMRHAKFVIDNMYEPAERRCPLPAVGHRIMRNKTFDPQFPYFPVLPYGRYLFTLAFIDPKGDTIGVAVVDGNASPRL